MEREDTIALGWALGCHALHYLFGMMLVYLIMALTGFVGFDVTVSRQWAKCLVLRPLLLIHVAAPPDHYHNSHNLHQPLTLIPCRCRFYTILSHV